MFSIQQALPFQEYHRNGITQYVLLGTCILISFGEIPRSEKSGLYGITFNCTRNCHTVFQCGCTILHSHLQNMRVLVSLHPYQWQLLSAFLIIAILNGCGVVFQCFLYFTNGK